MVGTRYKNNKQFSQTERNDFNKTKTMDRKLSDIRSTVAAS